MTVMEIGGKPYAPEVVIEHARKARGWYAAIAGFSFVNSVLLLFEVQVSFVIGLGLTQVVDALFALAREEATGSAAVVLSVVGLLINLGIIGVVMLIWWASGRGSTAAYLIGMVLYALDGLIFLAVKDWIGVGFHVFFLFGLWGGYRFMRERRKAEELLAQPAPPPQPELPVT